MIEQYIPSSCEFFQFENVNETFRIAFGESFSFAVRYKLLTRNVFHCRVLDCSLFVRNCLCVRFLFSNTKIAIITLISEFPEKQFQTKSSVSAELLQFKRSIDKPAVNRISSNAIASKVINNAKIYVTLLSKSNVIKEGTWKSEKKEEKKIGEGWTSVFKRLKIKIYRAKKLETTNSRPKGTSSTW